jgi:hypothetical protein
MAARANDLRWSGKPGHYEVYYLTLTDRSTGVGVWIRYTMLAPLASAAGEPSCALWFSIMDPRPGGLGTLARRSTFPIGQLTSGRDPFELRLAHSTLSDAGMSGGFEEFSWDLRWDPAPSPRVPINPLLGRLGVAKTVFLLPHADVLVSGSLGIGSERIELERVPGGQAHLWGSEHAESWAWAHCSDLSTPDGTPVPGAFFDGVSALVKRFGRTLGPNTPIVGHLGGREFQSTSPRRMLGNSSRFDVEGWNLEALDGSRKLIAQVTPTREQTVGVTYHDPDGREAYCYNSETASVQLEILERAGRGWTTSQRLSCAGRCHFEFGTRTPVPGIELQIT